MSLLLDELERTFEQLSSDGYCASPVEIAREAIRLLTPPERISITDCAARDRLIPNDEGGAKPWSKSLTPYILPIQDALDDQRVRAVVVVGPARTGKTVAAENALFKRLKHGPMTDVLWYLPGETDVERYIDTTINPLFELHPDLAAKIGKGVSDNKRRLKRIQGRFFQVLPLNGRTIRGVQARFIVGDEIDGFTKRLRGTFRQQVAIRARAFGNTGKAYLCSHPDAGWTDGISPAWKEGTRGIWYWPCPHCAGWSSPCPTAPWRMTLDYSRPTGMADDDLLDHIEATACLTCPHCGSSIFDESKTQMLALGRFVHEGETITVEGIVTGEVKANDTWSFWIHGTMSPFVSWGKLAREYVGALVFYERTRKPERLREVTAKSLGEVYEGGDAASKALDAGRLKKRVKDAADAEPDGKHRLLSLPRWVLFLTAAVDVGGDKFDVLVMGWGRDGESCIVDRYTLKTDPATGRSLKPGLRQADWMVIRDLVMKERYPFAHDLRSGLGIASTAVDTGGVPGVTWKARQFARQMKLGMCRGPNAYRLRLIKGAASKKAQEIGNGREVNKDDQGRSIEPAVTEYDLGVHKLKRLIAERIAVDSPGAGYLHLPIDMSSSHIDEMTNEALVDEEWERRGPNETFDLLVYNEAARQLLKPERPSIDWSRPPAWARRIVLDAPAGRETDIDPDEPKPTPKPPADPKQARRDRLLERLTR